MSGRPRRYPGGDDGQIGLFILGCAVVAGLLIMTAAAVTQVHLGRMQLRSLADAAALEGANSLDEQRYYAQGALPRGGLPLSDATVRAAAVADLSVTGEASSRVEGLTLADPTGSPDGRTAEVTLTAEVRPWLLPRALSGLPAEVQVRVTSRARAGLVLP